MKKWKIKASFKKPLSGKGQVGYNFVDQGPVPLKMVKFNPGLSQILSKVFLSKNMLLELTKYFRVFTPRFSNDSIEFHSRQCIGR